MKQQSPIENAYDLITGDEDARVCNDIPEEACNDQPHNFFAYLVANLVNKIADELASAKLILPWLLASLAAGLLGIAVFALVESGTALISHPLFHALLFLALTVFHSGVRLGRKVYLVDLATADTRATYVAVSNTLIGIAMLLGGVMGIIADLLDIHHLILSLGVLGLVAAAYAWKLPEVSD
jgi:hypothetical protein